MTGAVIPFNGSYMIYATDFYTSTILLRYLLTVVWLLPRALATLHLDKPCSQKRIQLRQTAIFYKADPEYGSRVAEGLKLDVNEVKRIAEMSQEERVKATAK